MEVLTKSGGISEESLRHQIRQTAKERFRDTEVVLPAELVGIAVQVTQIDDPVAAVQELVNDALHRWARIWMLEHAGDQPDPRPLRKGVAAAPKTEPLVEVDLSDLSDLLIVEPPTVEGED